MQIHFKTPSIPTRAAKRVKRLAGLAEAEARQWTAEVLGYRNWHGLEAQAGKHEVTALDEKCTVGELASRCAAQLARLQDCVTRSQRVDLTPAQLLEQWQPSAAHPQVPATGRPVEPEPKSALKSGAQLAEHLVVISSHPGHIVTCVEEILPLLQECTRNQTLRLAANVSIQVLQKERSMPAKVAARRVLEVTASKEVPIAWFNLAMSLMLGDAGLKDEKRAVDLLQRLIHAPDAPEELRTRARSLMASAIAEGQGRPADMDKAVAGWEAAAEAGDLEAAFNAGLTLQGGPEEPVSQEQMQKAVRYYRIAAKAGHTHAATNLGLQLLASKELEEYPMESLHWIEKSASEGDTNARRALAAIRAKERDILRAFDRGELPEDQVRATFKLMEQMMGIRKR